MTERWSTVGGLTQEILKEWIYYDPDEGSFMWLKGARAGSKAGCIIRYQKICIFGIIYPAAKIAWLYMTGEFPSCPIDHKNRITCDDRWLNLRKATVQQNNANRSSSNPLGVKGVKKYYHRYSASIRVNGIKTFLGTFATLEEARDAYNTKAKEIYGEFAYE